MWKNLQIYIDPKDGCVGIESNDLDIFYTEGYGGFGLQCNELSDSEKYKEIKDICHNICLEVKKIIL